MRGRFYLMAEFLVLCVVVPTIIVTQTLAPLMFAFLWGASAYCALVYKRLFFVSWRDLWRWDEVNWPNLWPVLLRWVAATLAMLAFTWWYDPGRLFNIFYRNPSFIPWLIVMYPLVSALPQEFIFCSFFFKRYERYFGKGMLMVVASATVFAYAHILYINPVAPVISFIGGLIFATTFLKTHSLALVTIEHGLYGNSLFLAGAGLVFLQRRCRGSLMWLCGGE